LSVHRRHVGSLRELGKDTDVSLEQQSNSSGVLFAQVLVPTWWSIRIMALSLRSNASRLALE